ncbi:amidase signature enzyme [Venturia nashicola]|nr:amidase signature enzyme [Venturia nashicola]
MAQGLNIVEASIEDLQQALTSGQVSAVELAAKHLHRIAQYDRRGPILNAIPIVNESVFEAAQASDERRAAGKIKSDLDGVPCTIKDSYKIKGMTMASGSHAFQNLEATDDAFTVARIREAGGVIMGRTNMPPMAAGGMQRGVYGRAESPYNKDYLTAAFASGSSNGSATATAASFGAFGMGEETISSGRSPASNNGLVAYTPSRGLISIRGNWPLFPNCDTVVPHTRTMNDMFSLLDVIVVKDENKHCDFWREQPFVPLPEVDTIRPKTYHSLADKESLKGKKIGVPKMYIGKEDPAALPVHTASSVCALWNRARKTLESLGATVEEVDFPIVTNFEKLPEGVESPKDAYYTPRYNNAIDMVQLMAYTWDDFLKDNNDTSCVTTLGDVDPDMIFPHPPGCLRDRYGAEDPLVKHAALVDAVKNGRVPTFEIPGLGPKLRTLEERRKVDFEAWLDAKGLDCVVFPCAGDVGKADADINEQSARDAWRNGVLYSNGNCAIRQFGIPTVSVSMGIMADTKMPVNLTFATKAYEDSKIFKYAYAFEQAHKGRVKPGRTPELETDLITGMKGTSMKSTTAPILSAEVKKAGGSLELLGSVKADEAGGLKSFEIFVDGVKASEVLPDNSGNWQLVADVLSTWTGKPHEKNVPDANLAMVVVLAVAKNGRAAGKLMFA